MKIKGIVRTLVILMIIGSAIGFDQVSKVIIRHEMPAQQYIGMLDDHLVITRVENTGAFLSLGNRLPKAISFILLILLPLAMMAYAFYYVLTKDTLSTLAVVALCCIIGGGIGNLFDRALYGSVTDFLHIDFILFRTGVFNVADLSITTGVFMMLLDQLPGRKKPSPESAE
jgi:signal peptidase II